MKISQWQFHRNCPIMHLLNVLLSWSFIYDLNIDIFSLNGLLKLCEPNKYSYIWTDIYIYRNKYISVNLDTGLPDREIDKCTDR